MLSAFRLQERNGRRFIRRPEKRKGPWPRPRESVGCGGKESWRHPEDASPRDSMKSTLAMASVESSCEDGRRLFRAKVAPRFHSHDRTCLWKARKSRFDAARG